MTVATPIERKSESQDPFAMQRFTLYDVPWEVYEAILNGLGEQRVYLTYNRGALELMSPSPRHEKFGSLVARLVQMYTHVMQIPVFSRGQTTWRRRDLERGLEADQCFYIQHEPEMRHKESIDLSIEPPPDLAIEIDLSSSSVDKEDVYAGLGIPELWRYEDGRIAYTLLRNGKYQLAEGSQALPGLPNMELNRFFNLRQTMGEMELVRAFAEWVEQNLKPRA
ncbi:MAG TPA: Uma2 family endonuclease [Tepidisphaeraceae bacterium]|jgi:Uma2 family endonuclease